ncbi:hypothetical protein IV417_11720 [Alphaproteobacteria bacterium KMM 3653]|uniref:YCII-related domain-containing protein n=1 Tax=Harenicola maris TaxID=2841044 RepID=A0AAP2CT35_9RHOB|nr:hypothetical protein [Harenicola maris]
MAEFMFIYHGGGMPETEEEGAKMMAAWGAWMENHAAVMTNPGAPVGRSVTVTAQGVTQDGGANPTTGFTIVDVADEATAIEIAKGCPILDGGNGSVEIAPLVQL